MATIEIKIDNYLSEEEKKQYAIEAFKETIKKDLFKDKQGIQLDSETQRVIGNISHSIVMKEVQKYIPNCEDLIKKKTIESINKDNYDYYVFKKKDAWDKEESLAITYMNETIKQNKELFQKRIKETIANYDLSRDIAEQISAEFGQMADTIYNLAELFNKKNLSSTH
jgi:methyl-accepting chemotaxis protein